MRWSSDGYAHRKLEPHAYARRLSRSCLHWHGMARARRTVAVTCSRCNLRLTRRLCHQTCAVRCWSCDNGCSGRRRPSGSKTRRLVFRVRIEAGREAAQASSAQWQHAALVVGEAHRRSVLSSLLSKKLIPRKFQVTVILFLSWKSVFPTGLF